MEDLSPYCDKRREFFRRYFEAGLPYAEYIRTGSEAQQSKWRNFAELVQIDPRQERLVRSFVRKINVLCMSGIWCGDCARQGPILQAIADAAPAVELRFVDNKANPELLEELRINGAEKVPVVVSLSEDFFEVARFGDSHLSVYRKKAGTQLGAACDPGIMPPPEGELAAETQEWVDYFERVHWILRLAPMLRRRYGD